MYVKSHNVQKYQSHLVVLKNTDSVENADNADSNQVVGVSVCIGVSPEPAILKATISKG